jgi:soluble lytic murein transglycosylase
MKWSGLVAVAGLYSGTALAQTPATLEAVRLHRPEASTLVREELKACDAVKCPESARLALLAGTLVLSDGEAQEARQILESHPTPPRRGAFHPY